MANCSLVQVRIKSIVKRIHVPGYRSQFATAQLKGKAIALSHTLHAIFNDERQGLKTEPLSFSLVLKGTLYSDPRLGYSSYLRPDSLMSSFIT